MTWAKFAAAGNFLCAAWGAFLAYGFFLGEARPFFPNLSDSQATIYMIVLTVYALGNVLLGGLLIRGVPIAGAVSALFHVATTIIGFYVIDVKGSDEIVRQLPTVIFRALAVALDVKAAFALAAWRRSLHAGRAAGVPTG
jgi:hypothetical protein